MKLKILFFYSSLLFTVSLNSMSTQLIPDDVLKAFKAQDINVLKDFLKEKDLKSGKPKNIECTDQLGNTLLNISIQDQWLEGVEFLTEIGADVNSIKSTSPLLLAIILEDAPVIMLLVKKGARLNGELVLKKSENISFPYPNVMMYALANAVKLVIIDLLIRLGAEFDTGYCVLFARQFKNTEIEEYFKRRSISTQKVEQNTASVTKKNDELKNLITGISK